jgi:hypothetical protein
MTVNNIFRKYMLIYNKMDSLGGMFKTETSKIIVSIIWGLGLAALFRKVCKGRNCIVIKGPKPTDMDNKIFEFDHKCYKYSVEATKCN